MSISASLQASARAAYRGIWRASAITFAGDSELQNAFRLKMRTEIIPNASMTDPKEFGERVTLAREIAEVLRRNVAQVQKYGEDNWQLRLNEHTELGDNESIKNPQPIESSRSARKKGGSSVDEEKVSTPNISNSNIPRYYSQMKKAAKERKVPDLREEDIEEKFVRGSGPGGQSINKTENNVQLLHKPTGIRVTCQHTRSLTQNRMFARRLLLEKLDQLQNPGLSKQELLKAKQIERERRRRRKARKKEKQRAAQEVADED